MNERGCLLVIGHRYHAAIALWKKPHTLTPLNTLRRGCESVNPPSIYAHAHASPANLLFVRWHP